MYVSVAVSGAFFPFHSGHVDLLEAAKLLGDELIVILNNDHWMNLVRSKGQCYISEYERAHMVEKLDAVDAVILTQHGQFQRMPEYTGYSEYDISVGYELENLRPDILARGSSNNYIIPEVRVCKTINCEIVYDVGVGNSNVEHEIRRERNHQ